MKKIAQKNNFYSKNSSIIINFWKINKKNKKNRLINLIEYEIYKIFNFYLIE